MKLIYVFPLTWNVIDFGTHMKQNQIGMLELVSVIGELTVGHGTVHVLERLANAESIVDYWQAQEFSPH